ncbi:MAG: hypothetical protein K9G33_15465 [Sneathiella sp.]|nr:hypothetical protein [Sneathiella sp.]
MRNILVCLFAFLGASILYLVFALGVSARSLGGLRAACVYLLPFALAVWTWILFSVACGSIAYFASRMFFRTRTSSVLMPGESTSGKTAQRSRAASMWKLLNPLYIWVLLVAVTFAICGVFLYDFYVGTPYEEVTFPGTRHPSIEVRYNGFVDQQAHVFIAGPIYRERILDIPWTTIYRSPTNPPPRPGQGKVKMAMSHFDPYGVWWSKDGHRLAISIGNQYVGGYDLTTGQRIEKHGADVDRLVAVFLKD